MLWDNSNAFKIPQLQDITHVVKAYLPGTGCSLIPKEVGPERGLWDIGSPVDSTSIVLKCLENKTSKKNIHFDVNILPTEL